MNLQNVRTRTLIIAWLSTLVTCLLFLWLQASPPTLAQTEGTSPTTATETVERWHGTVTIEEQRTSTYAADCPWICVGNQHRVERQEWNLEVQEDGSVHGTVRTTMLDYSYDQTKTNNSCGPVAETNYTLENCVFHGQLTQPNSIITVQGVREIERFTERPVLRLTSAEATQECDSQWSARGIHSISGAIVHKQENTECTMGVSAPNTFYIVTYSDGRAPKIFMNYSFSAGGSTTIRTGYLTATTVEPMIELDREMLERSVFLDQVPVEEMFTANMEWNSPDGGWVTWQLSDAEPERIGPTEAGELPKPINNGMQGVGRKKLTVQAQNTLNVISQPQVTQVTVAPPPAWAGGPSQISATKVDGAVTYKGTFKFPEPPFEGTVNVPDIVPFIGGKRLGVSETQGSVAWEAQSTSEGQGSLSGQTGFTMMDRGVVGALGGRARLVLNESGVSIPEGGIDFGISGTIASDPEPLLKVVPSLRPIIIAIEKISSEAAAVLNNRATAKLEVQPKLDFGFNFHTENDEIKFKNAEAKPGFGFRTVVELNLIKDVLQATASIGGAISATFKVPEPYFKEAALQGMIQAQILLYRWAWEGEKAWSVVVSGASAAIVNANQLFEQAGGSWQPLDRSYLAMPNYARWHDNSLSAQAVGATEDELLVENNFPLANPSLHVRTDEFGNTRLVQAWTHDDPNDPVLSGGEIVYSRNFGTAWQNPSFVTNDTQDDFAPKAVTLANNQTLLVWQRMDTPTPPNFNDDPEGYLSHWQIVSQRIGGDADFELLSTSASLNYRHQLGAISDGALAVWVNNPANRIIGDAANPDHILYARYTNVGDSWSPTSAVISGVVGLLDLDLATNGAFGALVYSLDMNSAMTTTTDQELFYVTWNGTTWSAPTRLTNNSVSDESPQLVLAADGTPRLVWRQNGELKFLQGDWNSSPIDLPLLSAAERTDYDLVQSLDGHLALLWQEVGPTETRIGYALYDAIHNVWGQQLTLPMPEGSEGGMATSIAAAMIPADEDDEEDRGALVFAYQLAQVDIVTRTVDNVETGTGVVNGVSISNIADIVQYDLRYATVPLGMNLSVSAADLSIPPTGVLQAVIHNTGPLAVANAPVVLHVGSADPVSGESQSIAQTVPLIPSGSSVTVDFSIAGRSETIFSVEIDPERTLGESDYSDNFAVLGTDLGITLLPSYYSPLGTVVRGHVTQQGNRYISLIDNAALTLDRPDGEVLAGSEFGFPLAPASGVTVSAFISTTRLGAGRHQLYWTLDPDDSLAEANRENNIIGTTIMILPDLASDPELIHFGTAPGNTAIFSMTVQNLGNWPNGAASLKVFNGPPTAATSHLLLTLPIPAIEPGAEVELSGSLQRTGLPPAASGLSAIYVELDTEGAVDESNENNNSLAAGAVLEQGASKAHGPLYLPAIQR